MPRISAFYGIVIYMYWQDHPAPHFHAFYSGDEAQVRIADGVVMAGSLPTTSARLVATWVALNRPELLHQLGPCSGPGFDSLLPIEGLR